LKRYDLLDTPPEQAFDRIEATDPATVLVKPILPQHLIGALQSVPDA
jgi:hypothetical protein